MAEQEKIYDLLNLVFLSKTPRTALLLVLSQRASKELVSLSESNGFQVSVRNQTIAYMHAKAFVKVVNNIESWKHGQYSDIILPNSVCADIKRMAMSRLRIMPMNLFMY